MTEPPLPIDPGRAVALDPGGAGSGGDMTTEGVA